MSHLPGELAVALTDVTVRYRLPTERVTTLKEYVVRRLTGRQIRYNEFLALRNASLEVYRGEAIGIVGRNGAGKSTLLKVIARVLTPSSGRVWVRGNIAPLIELGAGFHPELTGRENMFINGAMLGFSHQQMQEKMNGIIEFSELGAFIDTPIRAYSSGMVARLAFSIAAAADPDVLIIDEALSVGDEAFQQKCVARMREYRDRGVTVFFVTHSVDNVRKLCPKCIWLEGGRIRYIGNTDDAVTLYRESLHLEADLSETQKLQVVTVERNNKSGTRRR